MNEASKQSSVSARCHLGERLPTYCLIVCPYVCGLCLSVCVCVGWEGEFCRVKGFVVTINDSAGPHTAPVDGPITFECVWLHVP